MLTTHIQNTVKQALAEDIGSGDITAQLVPADQVSTAQLITRERAVICGNDWFTAVFYQLDPAIEIEWQINEGEISSKNQALCILRGNSQALLSGERTALNFLQTMSGTATLARQFYERVQDLDVTVLDTRKTLPGLRCEQKYAVRCGGCYNHRTGLYDGILIKENHIQACGSIGKAIEKARLMTTAQFPIEVEVENLEEMTEALSHRADILLLDNFPEEELRRAVWLNKGQAKLEASGGITLDNIRTTAKTGVDSVSIGALTKDIKAIDLSMRIAFD